jgi:hypothetical protein
MVTEVAFAACHVKVTGCPLETEVELTEKVSVGDPLPPLPTPPDPQPLNVMETNKLKMRSAQN